MTDKFRLYVEGFGSPMNGYEWFVSGTRRSTKKQATEDLRKLKANFKELDDLRQQVATLTEALTLAESALTIACNYARDYDDAVFVEGEEALAKIREVK